jgi:uncharacterized protein (DUF1778 family)
MNNHNNGNRTALLIRCTAEEAELIREAAERERRTLSGFVLHAVMGRIASMEKIRWLTRARTQRLRT